MATASGSSGAAGQSLSQINVFPDEKKVRELAEQIRARLSHAHQLKLTASQQQQSTPAAAMQVNHTSLGIPYLISHPLLLLRVMGTSDNTSRRDKETSSRCHPTTPRECPRFVGMETGSFWLSYLN